MKSVLNLILFSSKLGSLYAAECHTKEKKENKKCKVRNYDSKDHNYNSTYKKLKGQVVSTEETTLDTNECKSLLMEIDEDPIEFLELVRNTA